MTSLRPLLTRLIDYAGLFPPAALPMADAVRDYARERAGEHAWMLGRFVVPVARLDELAAVGGSSFPRGDDAAPWPLSALAGDRPADDRARIDDFNEQHRLGAIALGGAGRTAVEAVEAKAADADAVAVLADAFAGLELYLELDHTVDPRPVMAAAKAFGARVKIRTGGVTEDAFPSTAEVARFLVAAADESVAFKATAGLHHPVRGNYRLTYGPDSTEGTMFGFLNVFLGAAFARQGVRDGELEALLEETEANAFTFGADTVQWRDNTLSHGDLVAAREAACSYGSCSFREPVEDLERLGLLEARTIQ